MFQSQVVFSIYFWFIRYSTFCFCLLFFICCILTKSMVYNHNQVFFYFCVFSGFFSFRSSLWLMSYLSHFYPFLNFCFYSRPSQHVPHTFKSAMFFFFLFVCFLYAFLCVCCYKNSFREFCSLGVFSLYFHWQEEASKVGTLKMSLCGIPHPVFTRGRASMVLARSSWCS